MCNGSTGLDHLYLADTMSRISTHCVSQKEPMNWFDFQDRKTLTIRSVSQIDAIRVFFAINAS